MAECDLLLRNVITYITNKILWLRFPIYSEKLRGKRMNSEPIGVELFG
jgi:hypothetical protein